MPTIEDVHSTVKLAWLAWQAVHSGCQEKALDQTWKRPDQMERVTRFAQSKPSRQCTCNCCKWQPKSAYLASLASNRYKLLSSHVEVAVDVMLESLCHVLRGSSSVKYLTLGILPVHFNCGLLKSWSTCMDSSGQNTNSAKQAHLSLHPPELISQSCSASCYVHALCRTSRL